MDDTCTVCGKKDEQSLKIVKEDILETFFEYYSVHGAIINPEKFTSFTFENATEKIEDLKMIYDRGDWFEAAKDNNYSLLMYFDKKSGLFEVVVSNKTKSGFLGMGGNDPEKVWDKLGYELRESIGKKSTWINENAKIVALYGGSDRVAEIHYSVI
jgi:hypothetical protein